ncbi:serine/threonine-protein kinase [Streptomyces sp. NPDC058157]|uniref:serine/threonine-protein kinase n=1 Tax=Streptomyces sp. NPDC058157 TaxID=3346360 RepID=UPI0036E9D646
MDTSEAGRRLVDGRFELIAPLGAGGMGTVWRARDIALHREVALKEVRPPDPASEAANPGLSAQMRERAVREARALARLAHPGVVTIHHIVEPAPGTDGHPWIVMELVKGGSLHDRLADGPLPVADVVRLGLDVLSALRAAHAEGVLHRDVKPANVLLRPDGAAVLTDFGIAALGGATALTSTGVLIGSPEYIAPERARGEEGLAASDLWSLGMMLYVAAEGTHPLRRATSLATVVAVLDDPIPAPVRSGPLGPVLERLLVRDPAVRPDGAALEALLRAASTALATGGSPAAPAVPPAYAPPPPPSDTRPFVPGGGSPYDATAPVTPARGRRRPVLIGALLAVALTGGAVGLVQAFPDGGSGSAGANAKGPTTGAPATTGAAGLATGGRATPATVPSARQSGPAGEAGGSMLTPDRVRTALAAFKQLSGTTTFVEMTVYEGYVLASIPTPDGAGTYDRYEYRDGRAKRTGPGGRIDDAKALVDMNAVNWDALPGLLDRAQKELGVTKPTSRYVIVEPWLFDGGSTSVRPYLSDEYGRGGYLYADAQGDVKKVYRS